MVETDTWITISEHMLADNYLLATSATRLVVMEPRPCSMLSEQFHSFQRGSSVSSMSTFSLSIDCSSARHARPRSGGGGGRGGGERGCDVDVAFSTRKVASISWKRSSAAR